MKIFEKLLEFSFKQINPVGPPSLVYMCVIVHRRHSLYAKREAIRVAKVVGRLIEFDALSEHRKIYFLSLDFEVTYSHLVSVDLVGMIVTTQK